MSVKDQLLEIYREYKADPAFNHMREHASFVPGRGSMNPELIMVGEAPGAAEDASGKPFKGPSGKVLDRLLSDIGLDRRNIFITNVVKYRPIIGQIIRRNRAPSPKEIDASRPYLRRELDVFRDLGVSVVTLGNTPLRALYRPDKANHKSKIGEWHGHGWYDAYRMYFAMYHPSVVLYDEGRYDELLDDMRRMSEAFGVGAWADGGVCICGSIHAPGEWVDHPILTRKDTTR